MSDGVRNYKILAVVIRPQGGQQIWGAEKSFIEIAKCLAVRGVEVLTVEWPQAISRSRATSFHTFELQGSSRRFAILKSILETIRVCRATKCSAIFAYTLYFKETTITAFVSAVLLRKPLFVSINDDKGRENDETPLAEILRMKIASSRHISAIISHMAYHVTRRVICRVASASFATSTYVADYAQSVLGARRVFVVGRGLSATWLGNEQNSDGIREKIYDAVYLGRVDKQKGIDTLFGAWRLVMEARTDARLLVIGGGENLSKVSEQAEELGIGRNIVFAGYIADENLIRDYLSSSRVFVFPSKREGFANAVAQAMACGLPCVISDIPELRAVYGSYAIFADVDNPDSFSKAILEVLGDEERTLYYGEKGKSFAKTLSWSSVCSKMLMAMSGKP